MNAEEAALRNPTQAKISVRLKHDRLHRFVRIEVEDNGSGVSKAVRERLFEAFVTTKPLGTGTGMGLCTVRNVTKRHGGKVSFQTTSNGTTFVMELPERTGFRGD